MIFHEKILIIICILKFLKIEVKLYGRYSIYYLERRNINEKNYFIAVSRIGNDCDG